MKLHLGCGPKYIPGWTHYDALDYEHVDVVGSIKKLELENDVADIIYAAHVVEHFGRWELVDILREWRRVLKPGGCLRLAVPDFEAVCSIYTSGKFSANIDLVKGLVCGGQKDEYDFHSNIFDEKSLTSLLVQADFKSIRRWDWRETEHKNIDDYSQAYIPHLEKDTGILVSLNLEAFK